MNLIRTSLILYPSLPGPKYRVSNKISNEPIVPESALDVPRLFLLGCALWIIVLLLMWGGV